MKDRLTDNATNLLRRERESSETDESYGKYCDSLIRKAIEKLSEYEKAENESLKKQLENTKSRIYISYEKGLYGDTDYAILFYVSPNKTFYVLEEFTEEKYGKKVKEVAEARLKEILEVENER